jgi:hypothetical protein
MLAVLATAGIVLIGCEMPDDDDDDIIDAPVIPTVPEPEVAPVGEFDAQLLPPKVVVRKFRIRSRA